VRDGRSSTPLPARRGGRPLMLLTNLTILVLAGFVGFAVISKVPNTLHTPLMSGTTRSTASCCRRAVGSGYPATAALNKLLLVMRDPPSGTIKHRRRISGHRPDARDVQAQADRRPQRTTSREPRDEFFQRRELPRRPLHRGFALFIYGLSGLTGPAHRRARQPDRRRRHGDSPWSDTAQRQEGKTGA